MPSIVATTDRIKHRLEEYLVPATNDGRKKGRDTEIPEHSGSSSFNGHSPVAQTFILARVLRIATLERVLRT